MRIQHARLDGTESRVNLAEQVTGVNLRAVVRLAIDGEQAGVSENFPG